VNEQQKRFADFYIETGNATDSYKRAGYKAKGKSVEVNASRLLANAKVSEYIEKMMESKDKERIASQDEVLSFLTQVLRGEVTEQTPITMKDYWEMADKEPSLKDRTKAAELLGKRYAMWTDKVNHNGDVKLVFEDDYGDDDQEEDKVE
jgi:phage terminase small subunit